MVGDNNNNTTKHIVYESPSNLKTEAVAKSRERVKKMMAKTDEWDQYILSNLSTSAQKLVVEETKRTNTNTNTNTNHPSKPSQILLKLIKIKQQGYKAQDIEKALFDETKFVDLATILTKLGDSELQCFYCKEPVLVFYEFCRDPKQWTLERIDNEYGHNRDNVEIACLQCNVRRRTMFYERYQVTKQCVIRKLDQV